LLRLNRLASNPRNSIALDECQDVE
jgi:hypothetical protein